jgi:hypothetical protein
MAIINIYFLQHYYTEDLELENAVLVKAYPSIPPVRYAPSLLVNAICKPPNTSRKSPSHKSHTVIVRK